ncbi:MAG: AAA family ATPase, partial [Candidatus Dormibacteraeota bacterium]|nr:AAA family ATPase [Candidatus Dormibacteraeota bacterium]
MGRQAQMADARRMLAGTRLLTLAGPGGGGKTRLALELAPKLASGFADGVWLVELAAVSRPDLVTQRVAAALGVRESAQRPLAGLAEQLAERRMLLLLDNCEHLVETTARLAESLLQGCPDLYIVATSRESLNVPGEVVMRVPALSLPDLEGPLNAASVGESEAVALFVERA